MKSACTLTLAITLVAPAAFGQSLVDANTNYSDLFNPSGANVTTSLTPVSLGGSTTAALTTNYWHTATAGGGLSVSVLLRSAPQVKLTGTSLEFDVVNSGVVGNLLNGGVTGIASNWSATATFDKSGNQLLLAPNTTYQVSFYVDGSNGLLNSTLGIAPTFTVEMLDGAGTNVGSASSSTLVNVVGLLGTGVQKGQATVNFTTGSAVNGASAASLRFSGNAILNATALGLGTNFATVSNVSITQVPEPSNFGLIGLSALVLLRRRR